MTTQGPVPLPRLREIREAQGLSRPQLAALAGCSVGTVEVAEGLRACKRSIGWWVVQQLAGVLGVSIETLRGETAVQSFVRRREEIGRFLLEYRAVHYRPVAGGAKRRGQAQQTQQHQEATGG